MSEEETDKSSGCTDIHSVQYFRGLEPSETKQIQAAVEEFKFKAKFGKENDIVVHELHVTGRGSNKKTVLAHRYRVVIKLGEDQVNWPVKHGEYLTYSGVISFLKNLAALWNLINTYRTKRAIEHKKRISHLQKIADADAKKISKW